ncbi:MAG: fibronectin type III domain-containing protein [Verrucomicrobiae bacterium]|nr:fibronectin type III domain-containing protein [Verrucomicrobiae bacterium]
MKPQRTRVMNKLNPAKTEAPLKCGWRRLVVMAGAVLLVLTGSASWAAQIVKWDFSTYTLGSQTSPQAETAKNPNVTIVGLTKGTGMTLVTTAKEWGQSGFSTSSTTEAAAITANNFATFSITAVSGYTTSVSGIAAYNIRRSSTGPTTGIWQYQIGAGSFVDIGSAITYGTVTSGTGNPQAAIDLSGISDLQNVASGTTITFRVVSWGATGTSGTWGFNDQTSGTSDLIVNGAVVPPAPPAPTVNAAAVTNANDFTASWNAASTATGYQLDVATDSGFSSILSGYNSLDVGNVLTTSVSGLTANTVYFYRLRAYNGGGVSGNSSTITVKTLAVGTPKITVTLPGEGSANSGGASDETAGTAFSVTLTATTDGTTVNAGYTGVKSITFSGPTGSPIYPATVSFSAGVGTASITLKKVESPTITATDGTIGGKASSSFNVVPGAIDHYAVAAGSTQVIGVPFNVTVTALDASGNTVTTDSSTAVTLSSASGNVVLAVNPVTLVNGTNGTSATDSVLETTTITATDGNSKTGVSGGITFNPVPKYRTKQSGNWGDFTTWQIDPGTGFVDAISGQTPTSFSDTIEILTGHTVTVAAPVTADQVTVDAGGKIVTTAVLTINHGASTDLDVFGDVSASVAMVTSNSAVIVYESSGKYQHNVASAGFVPFATWKAGSTCEITNQTVASGPPSGLTGQAFYNFVWNCPAQGASINLVGALTTINGNLTVMATGAREFRFGSSSAETINIAGNWMVQGGTNTLSNGTGSPIINLGGNLVVTGGGLNVGSGAGTGTINASGDVSLTAGTILGTGTINLVKAGTQTFTGGAAMNSALNWTVADNSTLAIAPGSTLGGTGTFTVSGLGAVTGSGTINGAATVNGTLAPGTTSTFGTLTFVNLASLAGTDILKINRNGGSPLADQIVFPGGALAYGGTLVVSNIGAALQVGDAFTVFNAGSYSGAFSTTVVPDGVTFDTTPLTSNGSIVVTAVTGGTVTPIPLGVSSAGGAMTFTWADGSFSLQTATNVAGPYSTIPGAASGFSTNMTAAQMFFRLSHP